MPQPSEQEIEVFNIALELPAGERAAYLDRACLGNAALRGRVEELLKANEESCSFLEGPAVAPAGPGVTAQIPVVPAEKPGDKIGRYKLLQQIGEGGCGVVYMAEQEEPVRRRVALKVIKLGMDTKNVIARFEAERQALAMMDHPHIARVFDAGATETGRPYFVMELVRGVKITDYCDQNNLSTHERLNLFIQICHAIQHAHQKGIIHRDVKPSNILVTVNDGVPVPKVIDFGIAKATQGKLTNQTFFTAFEQFLGTPAYMSPEQAAMTSLDIDTRSDIYSLGVLLYELLTGQTPFDAKDLLKAGLDEIRRTIREKQPPRPSTRLSTMLDADLTAIAKNRNVEPPKLIPLVRGDLDWIVMKALEKERARRYDTANGLAMDVHRHLSSEPIVARPPTRIYRFQKLVHRNKLAFAAATAVGMALIIGMAISTWMFVRERQAHNRTIAAELEQSRLRQEAQKAQESEANQKLAAQEELYHSLVGQARAIRLARRVGYREDALKLLQQARNLHVTQKDLIELRREAVACLGDFVGFTPTSFSDFPTNLTIQTGAVDSTGKLAAFALSDRTIHLRELPSGREITCLTVTNNPIDVCFNPKGDQLFSLCKPAIGTLAQRIAEGRLYVWSRGTDGGWRQTENSALPGAGWLFLKSTEGVFIPIIDWISSLADLENGFDLINLKLFDLNTRKTLARFEMTNVLQIALSPDGRFLATETVEVSSGNKAFLDIWDFKTGQRINRQDTRLVRGARLSLSPDGKYLSYLSESGGVIYTVPDLQSLCHFKEYFTDEATLSTDRVALPLSHQNRIRLWNLIGKEDIALLDEPEPTLPLAFAPDGSFLLTYGGKLPWLYRLDTAEKLSLPAHADAVTGLAFSPDGTRVASVGKDRVLRVCDATTGAIIWEADTLPGPGQCVGYSSEGKWLVTGDYETDSLWIWDAHTGKVALELGTHGFGQTYAAQFSPDGRYLAAAGQFGIRIWTIERNPTGAEQGSPEVKLFRSLPGYSHFLLFSPNSRNLVFNNDVQGQWHFFLWDFDAPIQPLRLMTGKGSGVQRETFTPDSRQLLMGGAKGEILTLDVATGNRTSSFLAQESQAKEFAHNICLSPDGSKLAMGTRSMLGVEIWDPRTGKLLYSLPEQSGVVYWLSWSPDGHRLAVSRDNGDIAIWNLKEIEQLLAKLGLSP